MTMPSTHPLIDRLWTILGAVSVRTKILGIVLALVVLLGIGITLQVRAVLTQTLDVELQQQSVSITRDLAARTTDLILTNDLFGLRQLMKETQANNPDVRYVFVIDSRGHVLSHLFGDGFPEGLVQANWVVSDTHHQTAELTTDEGIVWDTAVPIFNGRAGVARVGLSKIRAQSTVDALTGQLLLTTFVVSAIGVTAAGLLTWLLTRPILQLAFTARRIGQGDFTARVQRWANDEVGELADAFNSMGAALQKAEQERHASEQLRAHYVKGVIAAQEDERKRIARELHDSTSQSLTSLLIGLRTLGDGGDSALHQRAEELRVIAAHTLDEVHTLALQLRPSVLDDLGLSAAIERYVADCRRHSALQIDLVMRGLDGLRLPAEVETALYRIVQEALTNVLRHANAQTASVLIERRNTNVRAIVEDDGRGFNPAIAGKSDQRLGLYGMHERAQLLGGKVTLESEPDQGSSVFVEIPLITLSMTAFKEGVAHA